MNFIAKPAMTDTLLRMIHRVLSDQSRKK
jgi:hypothetical protein